MSTKNAFTLQITGPDGKVVESTSDQDSLILGSGAGAAVRLSDPAVSNLHVMLKVDARSRLVTAIDLGSEGGTHVGSNRVKITQPVSLTDGEVLHVGASQVRVLFDAGAPRSTGAAAGGFSRSHEPSAPSLGGPSMGGASMGGPSLQAGASLGTSAPPHVVAGGRGLEAAVNTVRPLPAPQVQARTSAPVVAPAPVMQKLPPRRARSSTRAPIRFDEPTPKGAEPTASARVLQVAMLWGGDTLIDVQQHADSASVTLGEAKGASFLVYAQGVGERFTLVENKGATATLHVPAGATARVARDGRGVQAVSGSVELQLLDRAEVQLENVSFVVRFVRPGEALPAGRVEEGDFTFAKIAGACLLVFFALVAAVLLAPPPEPGMNDDVLANKTDIQRLLIKPVKPPDVERFKQAQKKTGADEGEKAKGDEGKFGKVEEKQKTADASKKGAPVVDKNKREEDRKKVNNAGLLGALGGGAASNVFGPGGLGSGVNTALGGLTGGQGMGNQAGVGGLGAKGSGTGGGGQGMGIGGLGTKGSGAGGPGGGGGLGLGVRGKEITKVVPGKTTVVGGLDKDVIAQVVKRHANEIRFCYEKELQKDPTLGGKVAVQWTIEATGVVGDAALAESTMGNANVEQCILSKVKRWKFPEAQNGGSTVVTFPWVFKNSGDAAE
jgi:TonB family protein